MSATATAVGMILGHHDKLIRSIAWRWARTTGQDQEELYSFARAAAAERAAIFDPEMSRPSTWLTKVLNNAIRDHLARAGNSRVTYLDPSAPEYLETPAAPAPSAFADVIQDLGRRVDWDANELLTLAVEMIEGGEMDDAADAPAAARRRLEERAEERLGLLPSGVRGLVAEIRQAMKGGAR